MKKLDSCPNGPNADICAGDTVQIEKNAALWELVRQIVFRNAFR